MPRMSKKRRLEWSFFLRHIFKLQKTLQQTRIPFSYDKLRQPFFMIDNILQKLLSRFF